MNFQGSSKNHQDIFNQEFFTCNSGKVIAKILFDDMVSDCGPNAEDEPLLKLLLNKKVYYSCERSGERPCMVGHIRCYKITDTCIYLLSQYNSLIPCRNGAHLQICSKFECSMMFKCSNSYCIPWSYVCNGKWDCLKGYDEVLNICNKLCKNMFKCKGRTNTCLHLGNTCDAKNDCPFGDDEMFCQFQKIQCPSVCNCLLYAIECHDRSDNHRSIIVPYPETYLLISFSNVKKAPKLTASFPNALFVLLPNNVINSLCNIAHFPKCLYLNVKQNIIESISKKCFNDLPYIRSLILSDNKILAIKKVAFYNLIDLIFLNISNNPLQNIPLLFSKGLLNVLHISKVQLHTVDIMAFSNVYINVIITKNHHICCVAPKHSICLAHKPWYISCSDILPRQTISFFYGIISILVIFLNTTSAIMHVIKFSINIGIYYDSH